jgi:hypothetical protein
MLYPAFRGIGARFSTLLPGHSDTVPQRDAVASKLCPVWIPR